MKKIVMCSFIATSLMFGAVTNEINSKSAMSATDKKYADIKIFDLNKIEDGATKGYLGALVNVSPSISIVIHDYYAAKYCDDDYYVKSDFNTIEKEVKELGASAQYGMLISALFTIPDTYKKMINNYRYMNCGVGEFTPNLAPVK